MLEILETDKSGSYDTKACLHRDKTIPGQVKSKEARVCKRQPMDEFDFEAHSNKPAGCHSIPVRHSQRYRKGKGKVKIGLLAGNYASQEHI